MGDETRVKLDLFETCENVDVSRNIFYSLKNCALHFLKAGC